MTVHDLLTPERGVEESVEDYKQRRKEAQLFVRVVSHGKTFWNSRELGTYRKPKNEN